MHSSKLWTWSTRNGAPRGSEDFVDYRVDRLLRLVDMTLESMANMDVDRARLESLVRRAMDEPSMNGIYTYGEALESLGKELTKLRDESTARQVSYFSGIVEREFAMLPRLSLEPAYSLLIRRVRERALPSDEAFVAVLIKGMVLGISDSDVKSRIMEHFNMPGAALERVQPGIRAIQPSGR